MKKVTCLGIFFALLCAFCLIPQTSQAHRLDVYAWLEGNQIVTESNFGKGHPVANAAIRVIDSDTGRLLVQGQTSKNGVFSFPVPKVVQQGHSLNIEVDAGQGHFTDWKISAAELYEAASLTAGFDQDAIDAAKERAAQQNQARQDFTQQRGGAFQIPSHDQLSQMAQPATPPLPQNQMAIPQDGPMPNASDVSPNRTGIIERAMDNQQHRAPLQGDHGYGEGPTIVNVLGGLGWIVGLIGIFLYWRVRKDLAKRNEEN